MSSFLKASDRPPHLDVMARFDALPPSVRRAISKAGFAFHPAIAERILRRGTPESRCIAAIEAADRRLSGGAR